MAPYSAPKPMSWTRWIPPSSVSNQAKTTAAPNSPPKEAAAKSPARTLKAIRFAFEPGAATSGAPASRSPASIPVLLSDVRSARPNPRLVLDPRRLASPSGGSQHLTGSKESERDRAKNEAGSVEVAGGYPAWKFATKGWSLSTGPTCAAPPGGPDPRDVVVEDLRYRTDRLAGPAVHALVRVDIEHAATLNVHFASEREGMLERGDVARAWQLARVPGEARRSRWHTRRGLRELRAARGRAVAGPAGAWSGARPAPSQSEF